MANRLRWAAALAQQVSMRVRLLIAVAVVLAFVLWLVLFAPAHLVPTPSEADLRIIDAARRLELQNDVRTTLLQGLGGLAVLIGAFFTYRQLRIAREGQVTERFTRAIDQLGNDNMDVRLGGIYALERIANDSPQDRAAIGEVLTAFVRGHAPWPPDRPGQLDKDTALQDIRPLRTWAPDVQAVLTVLGRRKPPVGILEALDLADTDLRYGNLRDADLQGATFEFAWLTGADLHRARLQRTMLFGAVLAYARLSEAELQGARMDHAQLQKADLHLAQLQGARLVGARLQRARAIGAEFQKAVLTDADLRDANLGDAQLQGADLRGAQLQGANLTGAQLNEAHCSATTVWPVGFDWKAAGVTLRE
jgi:hypothetical protein